MGFSVNTNTGAMAALQSLNDTNKGLSQVQTRINTGLNVSSTKDDSAAYTIAQKLRGDVSGMKAVSSSLSRAKSTTDVAVAGAEQISDILNQMKGKATEAADTGLDPDSRKAVNEDFKALRTQIKSIIDSSEFNGTNLLKATGGSVSALKSTAVNKNDPADTDATNGQDRLVNADNQLSVANQGLDTVLFGDGDATAVAATEIDAAGFTDAATAAKMVDTIDAAAKSVKTTLSTLGSSSRAIDNQSSFVSKLSDVVEGGIGNLVDADLAKESAKLQALQVKQQLGVQALSIANQAPQTITSLFR